MLWLAGASDVINNLHLSRFDVTDALKCAWPGAYRAISAAPLPATPPRHLVEGSQCFEHLTPDLCLAFLFSFFFSPLFSIRQLVALTSLHRGWPGAYRKNGTCRGTLMQIDRRERSRKRVTINCRQRV